MTFATRHHTLALSPAAGAASGFGTSICVVKILFWGYGTTGCFPTLIGGPALKNRSGIPIGAILSALAPRQAMVTHAPLSHIPISRFQCEWGDGEGTDSTSIQRAGTGHRTGSHPYQVSPYFLNNQGARKHIWWRFGFERTEI
jgi:hypothetical protein